MKKIKLKKKIVILAIVCVAVVLTGSILLSSLFMINVSYKDALFVQSCLCIGVPSPTDVNIPGEGYINHYQDESAKSEVTVEFDGETYCGEYSHSDLNLPYAYNLHKYKAKKDDLNISFSINSDTGELIEINIPYKVTNRERNEEECRKIADDFAAKYIKVKNYEVSSYGHVYVYSRKVDGYSTTETLRIRVNSDGRIDGFEAQSVGEFKYIKKVNCNKRKIEKVIAKKLDKVFGSENWTDMKIDGFSIVKVGKWKYGFFCQATVYTSTTNHSLRFIVK